MRAFDQARAIIDTLPTKLKHHPIIAFERCQTYWLEWRLKDYLRVLREACAWAEITGKTDNASGIHTLLRIALARAEVLVEGNFIHTRDSLREIRKWLADTPIDQYTDVQVRWTLPSPY